MVVHGGKGGKPFEDPPSKSDLTAIRIRARGYIDSLQCVYKDDTQTEYHGGNGGDDYLFSLDDGTVACSKASRPVLMESSFHR